MLGYVADNLRTGVTRSIQWHELADALAGGAVLVDVRTAAGARRRARSPAPCSSRSTSCAGASTRSRPARSSCTARSGQRGHTAARVLAHAGREVRNLDGGYRTWLAGTSVREPALTR